MVWLWYGHTKDVHRIFNLFSKECEIDTKALFFSLIVPISLRLRLIFIVFINIRMISMEWSAVETFQIKRWKNIQWTNVCIFNCSTECRWSTIFFIVVITQKLFTLYLSRADITRQIFSPLSFSRIWSPIAFAVCINIGGFVSFELLFFSLNSLTVQKKKFKSTRMKSITFQSNNKTHEICLNFIEAKRN